jgi:diguanylate cyclase (GGDEF)-like protein
VGAMNILMVEDNTQDAELLAATLRRANGKTSIERAKTLAEACHRVRRTDYDAVILDLGLPDSAGLSTLRRLQGANDCVPIVVMSGRDDDELAKEAVHSGAEDYMVKGDRDVDEILRTIDFAIERNHTAQELRYLVRHDQLTGAINRKEFLRELDRSIEVAERGRLMIGVFVLDLDHFKTMNELFGYEAGDQVLKDCVWRVRANLREGGVVARLKADELAVLVPGITSERAAEIVAERIHDAFETPLEIEGHQMSVSVTIGVAISPGDGANAKTLLYAADSAMHDAKEHGRNRTHYFSERTAHVLRERRGLRDELRMAIEQRQFEITYQPRFSQDVKEIHSLVASLRWRHPVKGLISADTLHQSVKGEDLFEIIEERALDAIVAQLHERTRSQSSVPFVSLPISTELFLVPAFPERVEQVLLHRSIDPWLLEVAFHEDVFVRDVGRAIENIHKLHDLGVRTAVSCIGTGPAPCYYTASLPIDSTIIAQAMVKNLDSSSTAALVNMLIVIAHDSGQSVTANGVVTESQFRCLSNMGCDVFQGDFFKKSLNSDKADTVSQYQESVGSLPASRLCF